MTFYISSYNKDYFEYMSVTSWSLSQSLKTELKKTYSLSSRVRQKMYLFCAISYPVLKAFLLRQ